LIRGEAEARWKLVAAALALPERVSHDLLEELVLRYSEPHRRYHALPHVVSVLQTLDDLLEREPQEVVTSLRLAAWYHDIIYDTKARDNEEQSARLILGWLDPLDVSAAIVDRAARMIRATANHVVPGDCPEAALLLDADLAILGAASADYDRYTAQIRQEYEWVPEADYRAGRAKVLTSFLSRDRIFLSSKMRDRYEEPAIRNLRREIAVLERPV